MSADSTGSVFLWVNRDVENFKSRDHKRVSKSYVQRAKHLKDWKHSKLRSSVSKTYFPWSFRAEDGSFGTIVPGNTRVPAGSEDASTFATGTHQPVPWSYPMIGPDVYQQRAARHPSEFSVATSTRRETAPFDSSWYPRLYDHINATESIPVGEAFPATEPSSSIAPSPTPLEYDALGLSNGSHIEAVDDHRREWGSFNPSRIYPQACLCQYRQPMLDANAASSEGQLGPLDLNIDAQVMTPRIEGSHDLDMSAPCPVCGSMPTQATDMYTTMLSTNNMIPDLKYSHSPLIQTAASTDQQALLPTKTPYKLEENHYLPWNHDDDWEYGRQYRG